MNINESSEIIQKINGYSLCLIFGLFMKYAG